MRSPFDSPICINGSQTSPAFPATLRPPTKANSKPSKWPGTKNSRTARISSQRKISLGLFNSGNTTFDFLTSFQAPKNVESLSHLESTLAKVCQNKGV